MPENNIKEMRRPIGRPPHFETADELWYAFLDYKKHVDDNPWQVKTASNSVSDTGKESKNNAIRQDVRVMTRAYTLSGFCAYAGICSKWADFKRTNMVRSDEFYNVIMSIENHVEAQQLDGALLHQFDGNIVARLNGYADKTVTELTGKDGEKFEFPKLTLSDIEELKKINGL